MNEYLFDLNSGRQIVFRSKKELFDLMDDIRCMDYILIDSKTIVSTKNISSIDIL